ncbi:MAG: DUF2309 domain-containing protein [Planctomycetota bacterium]|nr:DUF2309 domain-containing protein [Planctomycetota bacterium]
MTSTLLDVSEIASPSRRSEILAAAQRASRIVAPVWPLQHFVAVNPFLGLTDRPFTEAARTMGELAGARMTMPRSFYAEALRRGRITDAQLDAAIRALRSDATIGASLPADAAEARAKARAGEQASCEVVPTAADVLGRLTGLDLPRLVTERVSQWAASYFDAGQSSWKSPWRDLPAFRAWKTEAQVDRTPEVLGLRGFRAVVARLPETAADAIVQCVELLDLPPAGLERYLQRLTMSIAGWAAYARYQVWNSELHGKKNDTLLQLLAVRLAWELALVETLAGQGAREAWSGALAKDAVRSERAEPVGELALDLVLQHAYELGFQQELVARVNSRDPARGAAPQPRPSAQAAFCIDVRSEVFRRHLEAVAPSVETVGFAGFFGFPIEYIPAGQESGGAQCPVLLTPKIVVAEVVDGEHSARTEQVNARRQTARRATNLWRSFKQGAVSCFGFVGPVGLVYGRKLVTDALGMTRPVPHPAHDGIDIAARAALGPTLAMSSVANRSTGLAPADRLAMAQTVLKAMSLSSNLGRLVLLVGHGSTTVNNPHATGLDCGACGGHTGEANARVAVAVLNDPEVRNGLRASGLPIPEDTLFLAALHDTTTDVVTIFDEATVPASHQHELAALKAQLAEAGRRARSERAVALRVPPGAGVDDDVMARSRNWAQVRPEWGLAGCAAFIAAPRHRTAGLDLGGRSFLHSYAWSQDEGFGVLELILTAPVVVASWISLQYYGSTVDNRAFGSGNKVLHNVVGTLGVLEGNGGDLRSGLPLQSVHDGEAFVHEPLRLNVVIEAPREAMNAVLAKHPDVRALFDNGWLHLWAMDGSGTISHRYAGELVWEPVAASSPAAA